MGIAVHQSVVLQAAQAEQWTQDRHDLEVNAATWCQEQVQSVRTEAAQAVAAAQAERDIWLVATLTIPICLPCYRKHVGVPRS